MAWRVVVSSNHCPYRRKSKEEMKCVKMGYAPCDKHYCPYNAQNMRAWKIMNERNRVAKVMREGRNKGATRTQAPCISQDGSSNTGSVTYRGGDFHGE